eukprot:5158842-Lingulodinium_polyedra.AAC.1
MNAARSSPHMWRRSFEPHLTPRRKTAFSPQPKLPDAGTETGPPARTNAAPSAVQGKPGRSTSSS